MPFDVPWSMFEEFWDIYREVVGPLSFSQIVKNYKKLTPVHPLDISPPESWPREAVWAEIEFSSLKITVICISSVFAQEVGHKFERDARLGARLQDVKGQSTPLKSFKSRKFCNHNSHQ